MKTSYLGSMCLGPKSWEESGVRLYDYGFRIYNPGIARFLSVDPLAPSYAMLSPYQFAGNTPVWAVDLDGLEQLTTQQRQLLEQMRDPKLGNKLLVEPYRGDMVHPSGTRRSLVPAARHVRTSRAPAYIVDTPGGLESAQPIIVVDTHAEFTKEDVEVDTSPYDGAVFARAGNDAQNDLARQNIEFASMAGPSVFALFGRGWKAGKFSVDFLSDVSRIAPGIGVRAVNRSLPTTGFRHGGVRQRFTTAFNSIKNNINDHLKDSDLTGIIKDIHGYPSSLDGRTHLREVTEALGGLKSSSKALRELLGHRDQLLTGAARESAQEMLRISDDAIQQVTSLLSTARRSAANHAAG